MGAKVDADRHVQYVELPWGAWYWDTVHRLPLPGEWQVDILWPHDDPAWSSDRVEAALSQPIESPPLAALAAQASRACIVVDDLARPTKASLVLPWVMGQLAQGGIQPSSTSIVVATGSHAPLGERQLQWKVGEVASQCAVHSHDAGGPLVTTGIQLGQHELRLNRALMEADLKILIGSALPHSFAGYSGGAKMVIPGLADLEVTARTHKFVQMGLRGGNDPNANRFRLEAEDVCRRLGTIFAICMVPNRRREIGGLAAGDLVAAHRAACQLARRAYATNVDTAYDGLLLNAYPKDTDLIQSENSLVALKTLQAPIVREGGVLLMTTATSEGRGSHGLFQPGGRSYTLPRRKRALGDRELWLYGPNVTEAEARELLWGGYPFFRGSDKLLDDLLRRFGARARFGVLPCAPMQQLYNTGIGSGATEPAVN